MEVKAESLLRPVFFLEAMDWHTFNMPLNIDGQVINTRHQQVNMDFVGMSAVAFFFYDFST